MKNNFGEWVSVKDRLPNGSKEYLVTDGEFYVVGYFSIHTLWNVDDFDSWFDEKDITHWMELPELPK